MKKIPYGIFDYKLLKEEDYLYIDKTMYLGKLESEARTLIYLKPGRFGKSLFTSMMYYYYDINSKDLFNSLFKGTYVYSNPTINKNNYYVLKFDFSGLDTAEKTREEIERKFKSCVKSGIKEFLEYYKVSYEINDELGSDEIIREFLSIVSTLDHKIYILIDEYDNFTNAMLEGNAERFKSIVGNEGVLKAFYAVIKTNIGLGVVDRFFATGICPITLNSMTTGFNIATDISANKEFNSMVGLTHEEVKNIFSVLEIEEEKRNNLYNIMVSHYDGYKFSEETVDTVFNATLVMYFFKEYLKENKIPKRLYDSNITVNYGKIDNLIKLQSNTFYKDIIEEILKTGEIISELVVQFNLLEEFNKKDIISLLYYFGYLTIKEESYGFIKFCIPNYAMKETYTNYFLKLLSDIDIKINNTYQIEFIKEIINDGKIDKLSNYVGEILTLSDNRTFMKFDEKYVSMIYFSLLIGNSELSPYREYPCNSGYADIYLVTKKYNIIIEIKYSKKKEYNKKVLETLKKEASKQIESYVTDPRVDNSNLRKYIVIFVGNELKVLESV